jgi:hypothetical protein
MTPSGSVGSEKDVDIRDLLFGVVERDAAMTHIDRITGRNFPIAGTNSSDGGAE